MEFNGTGDIDCLHSNNSAKDETEDDVSEKLKITNIMSSNLRS